MCVHSHLKGVKTGVDADPPVCYHAMGAAGEAGAPRNQWRSAADWPVSAKATSYYLHPALSGNAGTLSTQTAKSTTDSVGFQADPLNPSPIPDRAFAGAKDAREYEKNPDVRTFTTEPLPEPVEWTGKVRPRYGLHRSRQRRLSRCPHASRIIAPIH